ncbi:MAG: DUF2087 domain-containing protein [Eubacterium sp.]|nr:DUF2087 domain-containing protein [Eubacterium sp.]
MTEMEAIALFKCLADRSRLQIVKSLAREDTYVELLAERLGLTPSTVSFHLKKLAQLGAVTAYKAQYYTMYSLCSDIFDVSLLEILHEESDDAQLQAEREQAYRSKVLEAFFEFGKLKAIPAQRKKERIILEEIAKSFAPERDYTEREVNLIIADFYDDFCTLRRDMIAEGLMTRRNGIYRRTEAVS